jgi:hypothetical protein
MLQVCGSEISVQRERASREPRGDGHRADGGLLVGGAKIHLGHERVRWEGLLILLALGAALAFLSACGSGSTTVAPTITASCVPITGTGADVSVNGTAQCTATVENASSTLVNWSVSGTGNGSIGQTSGLYTAPSTVPTNNVITITATSQVQSTLTATTTLTIVAATQITAIICDDGSGNPATTVSSHNTLSCTAFSSVSTGTTVPVNWSVANTNNASNTVNLGSISSQGDYLAPLVPPAGQSVTITATSQALSSETMSIPVTVVFGPSVLSGTYVFSTQGRLTSNGAFWARTGSLSAGGGTITGISEDTNQGGSPNTVKTQRTFTGSYAVGPDGRGTMQFCEDTTSACPQGSPGTSVFSIAVISPQQIEIIEYSPSITGGGEMLLQDPSVISTGNGNLSGVYSFNFSGVSTAAAEESIVGDFSANGHQTISTGSTAAPVSPGELDVNAGGAVLLPATTYTISSNGRGTVTLNSLNFSLYPISSSRSKFIEIDAPSSGTTPASILSGDAYLQQTGLTCGWGSNALSGSTVFETNGSAASVAVVDVGDFTASAGAVSAASIDENNGGTVSSQVGTLTGTYALDPDGCGRGTLSIGAHTYVFYAVASSQAVLQETTAATGVVAHGLLMPAQGGTFVDATLTGSYAFRFGGTDAAGASAHREDFAGQLSSSGSGTGLTGTLDFNDFGATQTGLAIANGTYTAPSGLRTTMTVPIATSPSTTRNLVLYIVSPTLFYALDTDATGTALGVIVNQF